MKVYMLEHVREMICGCDDSKLIGIYSSLENGLLAIERSKTLPGFCNYPDGFNLEPYEIDSDHWTEGFFTYIPPNGTD